jgi:hypothetical protein
MGFFNKIFASKEPGQYKTESQQTANRQRQLEMTPQTLEALREHGVSDDKLLPLEFSFIPTLAKKRIDSPTSSYRWDTPPKPEPLRAMQKSSS